MAVRKAFEKRRRTSVNLDFDARVPIPFSVFPSSYRSDAVSETTQTRVEGEVQLDRTSRVEREDTKGPIPDPRVYGKEEIDFRIKEDRFQIKEDRSAPAPAPYQQRDYAAEVDLTRERYPNYQKSSVRFEEHPPVYDQTVETQLDLTERDYRRRTSPNPKFDVSYERRYQEPVSYDYSPEESVDISYNRSYKPQPQSVYQGDYQGESYPRREVEAVQSSAPRYYSAPTEVKTTVREAPRKMGYYDDEGQYHSFRRGVERAADRIMHPFHHGEREEAAEGPTRFSDGVRENIRIVEPRGGASAETIPIPCHYVRVGDILILQGRPCQVIRISVSPQTGQHRYLGVDLFTRGLQEESSFISNPSPSVVVQTMLGPVYKTYRILDLRDDGKLVAMTETGDVKQGLPVITQGNLFKRIRDAFADGRGSVRALVINDGGRELVVDFKVIHGSRL
ncbi:uncharacterized protein N7477_007961 [Penicillium maclennaniae]|uniref:uncharacterized protein n=1 Tax=Penicillium maclennaniae TaxID=1343394 RepID=UPI00253FC3B9|nr:uncharacterized protein N7477_007961 [Penicillium maclennaniae]KAJ5665513.1 hypothetical protein N7477_007961 [Penicillium maclennaniae]